MAERTAIPDYSLDEARELRSEEELRAVADGTRRRILTLLRERAASTTELAEALDQPKGTVAHHLKVLEDAKLVRVVRTRKVRALTERYYGRVARVFHIVVGDEAAGYAATLLRQAADEVAPDAGTGDDPSTLVVVHARVPESEAKAFARELKELAAEFHAQDCEGGRVFGLVAGVYATDFKGLPKKGRRRA